MRNGSDAEVNRLARRAERELRRLVRSNVVRAGRLVTLPAVPIPFLASAPLLEGAWIDVTVLQARRVRAPSSPTRAARCAAPGTCISWPRRSSSGPTRRLSRSRSTRPPGTRPKEVRQRARGALPRRAPPFRRSNLCQVSPLPEMARSHARQPPGGLDREWLPCRKLERLGEETGARGRSRRRSGRASDHIRQ